MTDDSMTLWAAKDLPARLGVTATAKLQDVYDKAIGQMALPLKYER